MQSTLKFSVILALVFATTFSVSCKKYEEGPGISLRSKKGRVAGKWLRYKMDIDGVNQLLAVDLRLEMKRNGDFLSYNEDSNGDVLSEVSGEWSFGNDKEQLVIDILDADPVLNGASTVYWDIVRLKHDDLWIEYQDNNTVYEIRFRAQK